MNWKFRFSENKLISHFETIKMKLMPLKDTICKFLDSYRARINSYSPREAANVIREIQRVVARKRLYEIFTKCQGGSDASHHLAVEIFDEIVGSQTKKPPHSEESKGKNWPKIKLAAYLNYSPAQIAKFIQREAQRILKKSGDRFEQYFKNKMGDVLTTDNSFLINGKAVGLEGWTSDKPHFPFGLAGPEGLKERWMHCFRSAESQLSFRESSVSDLAEKFRAFLFFLLQWVILSELYELSREIFAFQGCLSLNAPIFSDDESEEALDPPDLDDWKEIHDAVAENEPAWNAIFEEAWKNLTDREQWAIYASTSLLLRDVTIGREVGTSHVAVGKWLKKFRTDLRARFKTHEFNLGEMTLNTLRAVHSVLEAFLESRKTGLNAFKPFPEAVRQSQEGANVL